MSYLGIQNNNISWKGLTFQEITSSFKKNTDSSIQSKLFFSPLPLKIYRQTLQTSATTASPSNQRQTNLRLIEQPSGVLNTTAPICSTGAIQLTTEYNIPNSSYENDVCNQSPVCVSQQKNALQRTRSSGMIRNRQYNVNSQQLLQNRNKTYLQNNYHYLQSGVNVVSGSPASINNTYVPQASGQFNVPDKIVIYKPSNWKFSNQGAVSSSSLIFRKRINAPLYNIASS